MSSSADRSTARRNDSEVGDGALQALIPFSGAFTPTEVRERMVGPIFDGPATAIWRKTTITHTNADGFFSLYACERTGKAMWVPSGESFVANRPRGASPAGTVMDYLFSQRQPTRRSESYGINYVSPVRSSQHGKAQGPRAHQSNIAVGVSRGSATRPPHRFNPIARPEPSEPGTGSKQTVSRRERRERLRENHSRAPQLTETHNTHSAAVPDASTSTNAGSVASPNDDNPTPTTSTAVDPSSVTQNNDNSNNTDDRDNEQGNITISALNLWDEEEDPLED